MQITFKQRYNSMYYYHITYNVAAQQTIIIINIQKLKLKPVRNRHHRQMKSQLKKLKGTTLRTVIGEITLKQYFRLEDSQYDEIYFKTTGIESITKIYDLSEQASSERFNNEMYNMCQKQFDMIYDRVHCEELKLKKVDYGLVVFNKLDREVSLLQCMSSLSGFDRMKLAICLLQFLQQLKEKKKIYCNIRSSNIYKIGDKFVLINAEFLRFEGSRSNMDSFMLESIQNNWKYWPAQVADPYSNQPFDYCLDAYAVGCTLYQCISGKYPFESKLSANSYQFPKLQTKNMLSRVAEMLISPSAKRRSLDLKDIIKKLNQCSNQIKVSEPIQKLNEDKYFNNSNLNNNAKKVTANSNNGGGIFDNISNVFSKMMNDTEGWFLNYVQEDNLAPNQKHLDNILFKMYKKQQKAEKLSSIIFKFVTNNPNKHISLLKTVLLIGQAIRRGPEVALTLMTNIATIKNNFAMTQNIQSLCQLIEKKAEVNEKFKKIFTGNFYLSQISNFKKITVQQLKTLVIYLQYLINFLSIRTNAETSAISQCIINFACDQIYDLVSIIILSLISIRKDNQIDLRHDNLSQLQPLQKMMNNSLKKLSNLSNFISAHAIYSLECEYIPYQQQITLKSNPYYSTMEYFFNSCRNYKGLGIPVDYATLFSSNSKDDKKTVHSASKQMIKYGSGDSHEKNYFKAGEIGSDDEDEFNKSYKAGVPVPELNPRKGSHHETKDNNFFFKEVSSSSNSKNVEVTQTKIVVTKPDHMRSGDNLKKKEDHGNRRNQVTFTFEEFANINKKKVTSPPKQFDQFLFFGENKKPVIQNNKPPLPAKSQTTQVTHVQVSVQKTTINFEDFFEKSNKKQTSNSNASNKIFNELKQTNNSNHPNSTPCFDPLNPFMDLKRPPQPENPLVKKILQGLKLKQLKDLITKNKNFVLDFTQLKIIRPIGSGSAGLVHYGKYKDQDVAIKKVKAKQNPNALKQFQRQLVTYIKIKSNPYLVSLVGLSESNGDFYLITQFCQSGSLFDLIHKKKLEIVLSWKERLNFAMEIAQGMQFLHSMKPIIIHRDLKSLNVFVTKINNCWRTKVADFGLSRSPQADMMTTQLGTIHWMAPELLEGKQYSFKVDVYSYGILLWEILSRTTPYSQLQNPMAILKYVVIDHKRPTMQSIPKQCPQQLIKVMQKCWAHDPNDRPSFTEVIKQLKMINL